MGTWPPLIEALLKIASAGKGGFDLVASDSGVTSLTYTALRRLEAVEAVIETTEAAAVLVVAGGRRIVTIAFVGDPVEEEELEDEDCVVGTEL